MEYSIKDTQPKLVSMKPIVLDELNPFKFKEDKSVRFSDVVRLEYVDMDRSENINHDKKTSHGPDDFHYLKCRHGGYIDKSSERMELISNNLFNNSPKINNRKLKNDTEIISKKNIHELKLKNYNKDSDPINYIATSILVDGDKIIEYITDGELLDAIIYMMEIYEYLEEDNTTMTLDYKHGVTISNREGKRQRDIVKDKVSYLMDKYM